MLSQQIHLTSSHDHHVKASMAVNDAELRRRAKRDRYLAGEAILFITFP